MKTSGKKVKANRINSAKGGEATKNKFVALYLAKNKKCPQCDAFIPYEKRYNTFCDTSCAASYNNTKRKQPNTLCKYCGNDTGSIRKVYCSPRCCGHNKKIERTDKEIRARRNEIAARYRARLRSQIPEDADREAIREFYKNCPVGHEVDHIIPISKGGLHILDNLQYLTVTENRKKSNKMP